MENQKEYCENLIRKWKELESKSPKVQEITPIKPMKSSCITIEEIDESDKIVKRLKNECLKFLSLKEQLKINEKIRL